MKTAKTITHILAPLFVGLIIGGAIAKNTAAWVSGLVLLIVDIIVGIILQYFNDRQVSNDNWNNLTFDEKRKIAHDSVEQAKQSMRNEGIDVDGEIERFCDEFNREHKLGKYSTSTTQNNSKASEKELCGKFNAIFLRFKLDGGARLVQNISNDEAGRLLITVCENMKHAPSKNLLNGLYAITVEDLDDEPALVYSFKSMQGFVGQLVFIFLVRTRTDELRFFTVETSFPFALCEYANGCHLNYGQIELANVPTKIKEILSKESNKIKTQNTTNKSGTTNTEPNHTTGGLSFEKQLSSTFSVGYFLQIKNGIDTEAFSNMQNLLNQPFNVLQKNLAKCQTINDKIQTKLIFINHLIGLATEIGKSDRRYWGFITFMETTYSKINPIFDEVVDYIANNTTIEYNDDEEEDLSDEDYLIVNGKASEMFWSLFHALSESEAFLNFGMSEMSDKWYALLNNQI